MNKTLRRFQKLLRELFQFERSDLDFGIYRILNFKRDAVNSFIETELPDLIDSELKDGLLQE